VATLNSFSLFCRPLHKMITAYSAPVDEANVGAIVDYLVKTKGKN
jgi:hypothetical protein